MMQHNIILGKELAALPLVPAARIHPLAKQLDGRLRAVLLLFARLFDARNPSRNDPESHDFPPKRAVSRLPKSLAGMFKSSTKTRHRLPKGGP